MQVRDITNAIAISRIYYGCGIEIQQEYTRLIFSKKPSFVMPDSDDAKVSG